MTAGERPALACGAGEGQGTMSVVSNPRSRVALPCLHRGTREADL